MGRPSADNMYDVIVIGTGPIGQTVADRACAAGLLW
jgi:pyruvate/2-oxoglutarate dehydrogenase complex dihydrolipoamide dehydrogenase (E3) component